jgi:hypothetical protein
LKKGAKSFKIIGMEMTMKKYLLAFLIIMLGAGFLFPDSEVKLDVKTRFKEKYELKGVKWGVIYFLKENGYDLVEVKYTFDPKELNVDDTGFPGFIKEKVENIKKKEKVRAYFVGHAVADKVKELLDKTRDRKQKAEAE